MTGNVRHPLFIADWLDVIFVHFALDPRRLQPFVPLALDLHGGDAYVSLVAFTQLRLRPTLGGRLGQLLLAPIAHHEFLNVRTYVRHGDDRGIFFMAEWIPSALAAFVGPRTYGLPYRLGRLSYSSRRREIEAAGRRLTLCAQGLRRTGEGPIPRDERCGFLLERYTAFTHRRGVLRRFDVDHTPWPRHDIEVELLEHDLLDLSGDWLAHSRLAAAHYSPGVRDVIIGRPRVVLRPSPRRHAGA